MINDFSLDDFLCLTVFFKSKLFAMLTMAIIKTNHMIKDKCIEQRMKQWYFLWWKYMIRARVLMQQFTQMLFSPFVSPRYIWRLLRFEFWTSIGDHQVHNQLGTTGGAKSFLRGAQIFWTMSNTFFQGEKNFLGGSPPLRPLQATGLETTRWMLPLMDFILPKNLLVIHIEEFCIYVRLVIQNTWATLLLVYLRVCQYQLL